MTRMPLRRAGPALHSAEIIVIGSGLAGLMTALRLAPRPVTLLTKTPMPESGSSALAMGGIAAAVGEGDTPEAHAADTVAAGAGLTDPAMAALLAEAGAAEMTALLGAGLPFDRGPDGRPLLGREAAHGCARILHAGGDATGRTLVRALIEQVRRTPSITLAESAVAVDLVVRRGVLCGVLAHHGAGGWVFHRCPRVVLATGGAGAAWRHTTNPPEATADGIAMAARAGVRLADLEFMQFHPTALSSAWPQDGGGEGSMPLLTEALRGAGALLVDRQGERFMLREHALAELAPRDVVARAVWRRIAAGEPVFLDCRTVMAGEGAGHFPTVAAICRAAGLDPSRDLLPVAPAAHYLMGGIATDGDGRTSLAGLWACGETASTGVHGANRLASNSLLESLVFAARTAADIGRTVLPALPPVALPRLPRLPASEAEGEIAAIRAELRHILSAKVGLERDGAGLAAAADDLGRLARPAATLPRAETEVDGAAVRAWSELRNLLLFARLATLAARNREESRGAHCRADFPEPVPSWQRHQVLTLADLKAPRLLSCPPAFAAARSYASEARP